MAFTKSNHIANLLFQVFTLIALLIATSCFAAHPQIVGTPQSISVVMDDNYPPYVFKGDEGQLKGIIVDQWSLWEKKTGIHVEISAMDWAEAQRRMQEGEFDVIDTIFRNEKREKIYDFTKPYAVIPVPLYFHSDISGIRGPDDAKGFMVAAKAGGNVLDVLWKHGVTDIVEYPSYEKIIEAARDGKVKVFTVDRPPALYYLNKMGIQNDFRETAPLYNGEFHRAVLKGRSDLLATVENGFAAITPSEYRAIDRNWLGTPISASPVFRYIGYSAAVITAIVIVLLVWLRLLRRAVSRKTKELFVSEERLSLALNASNSGIWDWNIKTGNMYLDATYFTLAGYEPDDFPHLYEEWEKRVHPDDIEQVKAASKAYLSGESSTYATEFRFKCKDGSWMWILGQGKIFELDAQGSPVRFVGTHTDITDRKKAEGELLQQKNLTSTIIESTSEAIFAKDVSGKYIFINESGAHMLGYKAIDIIGRTDMELLPVEMACEFRQSDESAMANRQADVREEIGVMSSKTHTFLSHKVPWLDNSGKVIGVVGISNDITERKRAEEERLKLEQQLLHTQKLESLGVLAGGIAHDFNNILTSIVGNADLALMKMSPESPSIDNLHRIESAAAKAADLAKQMLAYSGKGKFVVDNLDVNRLLEEMLHMLEVSISKKAVLRLNLLPDLPSVEADATQMRQILMNLVINASEAIGDKSGVIAITTGCMDCDKNYLKNVWLDENIKEGLHVYLEIADTGCGMDKDTLSKMFDPFFTTKFTGRGLGMAAVLGIVRGHNGAIKVYSEPGKGTTFKILLPASDKPAAIFNHDRFDTNWKGSGLVLLVDDEETVRGIGKEMLQELGFTVITANDGREAVDLFKANPDISFVILDLTMPHMDGEQCFRELRMLKPDVKVIMSSGFSEYEVTQKFAGKGSAGFIQKPYKLSVLKEAIQKI